MDSLTDERGEKLRKLEENSFRNLVKAEVEQILGPWSGSQEQNKCADVKIAMSIRSSFKAYENNKKNFEKSYFKF